MTHPFGYRIVAGTRYVEPHEPEHVVVRMAMRLHHQRWTLREIADEISAHYVNRAGQPFNATQVWRMLAREARYAMASGAVAVP
jgi:hypothetical protein